MKKFLILMVTLLLSMSVFVACERNESSSNESGSSSSSSSGSGDSSSGDSSNGDSSSGDSSSSDDYSGIVSGGDYIATPGEGWGNIWD